MFVKPRFVQFLTSVSFAAMFIATPLAVKFDGAAGFAVVTAAAFAWDIPAEPPADPVDPPADPVDPPTDPIDPPTDPIDPPTDPIGPSDPTDPVVQPTDPVEPTIPVPVVAPPPSNGDDHDPATPLVADIPVGTTPKQDGLDFVGTLRCQMACTASVTGDGEVTVTVTSTTSVGDTVETKMTQDGPDVETTIVVNDIILATAEENFESEDEARDVFDDRIEGITVSITLTVDFPDYGEETRDSFAADVDPFLDAIANELNMREDRFVVIDFSEG